MDGVIQPTATDPSFTVKEEPLEQQILPLLDQANKHNDIQAALKLIKVETLIQEKDDKLRCESCVKEEADNKENIKPSDVEEQQEPSRAMMRSEVPMEITFREFKELRKNIGTSKSARQLLWGLQEYFLIDHSQEFEITDALVKRTSALICAVKKANKHVAPYDEEHVVLTLHSATQPSEVTEALSCDDELSFGSYEGSYSILEEEQFGLGPDVHTVESDIEDEPSQKKRRLLNIFSADDPEEERISQPNLQRASVQLDSVRQESVQQDFLQVQLQGNSLGQQNSLLQNFVQENFMQLDSMRQIEITYKEFRIARSKIGYCMPALMVLRELQKKHSILRLKSAEDLRKRVLFVMQKVKDAYKRYNNEVPYEDTDIVLILQSAPAETKAQAARVSHDVQANKGRRHRYRADPSVGVSRDGSPSTETQAARVSHDVQLQANKGRRHQFTKVQLRCQGTQTYNNGRNDVQLRCQGTQTYNNGRNDVQLRCQGTQTYNNGRNDVQLRCQGTQTYNNNNMIPLRKPVNQLQPQSIYNRVIQYADQATKEIQKMLATDGITEGDKIQDLDIVSRMLYNLAPEYLKKEVKDLKQRIGIASMHPALSKVGITPSSLVEKTLTYRDLQNIKDWINKHYTRNCRLTASKIEDYLNFTDKNKERRGAITQALIHIQRNKLPSHLKWEDVIITYSAAPDSDDPPTTPAAEPPVQTEKDVIVALDPSPTKSSSPSQSETFECEQCSFTTPDLLKLVRHKRIHWDKA